jgi:hypothetical protein
VRWVDPAKLDELTMHPRMRIRIEHGLQSRDQPYLG